MRRKDVRCKQLPSSTVGWPHSRQVSQLCWRHLVWLFPRFFHGSFVGCTLVTKPACSAAHQEENEALEVAGLLASYLPEIEAEVLEAYPNARNEIATAAGRRSFDFSGAETPADSAEETPAAPEAPAAPAAAAAEGRRLRTAVGMCLAVTDWGLPSAAGKGSGI